MMMRIPVVTWVTSDLTEFSQGMILPTANRAKLPQPETKKSQIQTSKTQVDFSSPKPAKYSASGPESAVEVTSDFGCSYR